MRVTNNKVALVQTLQTGTEIYILDPDTDYNIFLITVPRSRVIKI